MRILVISNLFPPAIIGGYEICCKQMVDFLLKRGHTVEVLTSHYGHSSPHVDGHVYRLLKHSAFKPGINTWPAILMKNEDTGTLKGRIRAFRPDVIYIFSMRSLSAQLLPIVINGSHPKLFEIADDWPVMAREKNIFLFENLKASSGNIFGRLGKNVLRLRADRKLNVDWEAFRRSPKLFVTHTLKKTYMDASMAEEESACVVHNSIDLALFNDEKRRPFMEDGILKFLFTGQVSEHKSPHTILQALGLLRAAHPGMKFQFRCVGPLLNENYGKYLQDLIRSHRLEGTVVFHDKVGQAELVEFYKTSDLFIFSSQFKGEGFGLTLIESMACGLPVVTTDIGGTKDFVRDMDNCLIFQMGSAESLFEKIEALMQNPDLRGRLVANARRMVNDQFDMNKKLLEKEAVLASLCKSRKGSVAENEFFTGRRPAPEKLDPTSGGAGSRKPGMKVLVISNFYPPHYVGGYEIRCEETVNYLRSRGHDVRVLTSYFSLPSPRVEGRVYRILRHHQNPVNRGLNDFPWSIFIKSDARTALRVIESFAPDVVYIFSLNGLSQALLPQLLRLKIRRIFDFGDNWLARRKDFEQNLITAFKLEKRGFLTKPAKKLYIRLVKKNLFIDWQLVSKDAMIFNSRALVDDFKAHGILSENAVVLRTGVDPGVFLPVNKGNGGPAGMNFLYVAQVERHKGLHVLLQALGGIKGRLPGGFVLDVIGGNENKSYMAELNEIIAKFALKDSVRFLGRVDRSGIVIYYQKADIFISPTLHLEGLSRSILEAMSCGLPVIGTAIGGNMDILKDGENGLTVACGDVQGLGSAILRLCADPILRKKLGENGRAAVIREFDMSKRLPEKEQHLMSLV